MERSLAAAHALFIDHEIECDIVVPSRLYPFEVAPVVESLRAVDHIFVVEECVAGGTWGGEVAGKIYELLWGDLKSPIRTIHSRDSIIPSASHLERQVIVQESDIYETVKREVLGA